MVDTLSLARMVSSDGTAAHCEVPFSGVTTRPPAVRTKTSIWQEVGNASRTTSSKGFVSVTLNVIASAGPSCPALAVIRSGSACSGSVGTEASSTQAAERSAKGNTTRRTMAAKLRVIRADGQRRGRNPSPEPAEWHTRRQAEGPEPATPRQHGQPIHRVRLARLVGVADRGSSGHECFG